MLGEMDDSRAEQMLYKMNYKYPVISESTKTKDMKGKKKEKKN